MLSKGNESDSSLVEKRVGFSSSLTGGLGHGVDGGGPQAGHHRIGLGANLTFSGLSQINALTTVRELGSC